MGNNFQFFMIERKRRARFGSSISAAIESVVRYEFNEFWRAINWSRFMGSVSFFSCFSILVTATARNMANTRKDRGLRRASKIRVF